MRQAAMTISPLKPSRSRSGSSRWLTAVPTSDPPMPAIPNITPVPTRTRPARWWVPMPTRAAMPTRNRLVAVAARGSWPAA